MEDGRVTRTDFRAVGASPVYSVGDTLDAIEAEASAPQHQPAPVSIFPVRSPPPRRLTREVAGEAWRRLRQLSDQDAVRLLLTMHVVDRFLILYDETETLRDGAEELIKHV